MAGRLCEVCQAHHPLPDLLVVFPPSHHLMASRLNGALTGRSKAPTDSSSLPLEQKCFRLTLPRQQSLAHFMLATFLATRTPISSPVISAWPVVRSSTQWAGMTTDFPPNDGSKITLACSASRACRMTLISLRLKLLLPSAGTLFQLLARILLNSANNSWSLTRPHLKRCFVSLGYRLTGR